MPVIATRQNVQALNVNNFGKFPGIDLICPGFSLLFSVDVFRDYGL